MLVTIIGIIIMAFPFYLLAREEEKLIKKKEERTRREEAARKRPFATMDIKAIEKRWPFVTIPEIYFYRKQTDPTFNKPYTAQTLHQLRVEYEKERKECLRK